MKCLRCGYCCVHLEVIIVDNPERGISEDNLIPKPTGERCKHLLGVEPGEFTCAIHDKEWYNETPCFKHTQIEKTPECDCRMGNYTLKQKK
jgi:hypothetical protein